MWHIYAIYCKGEVCYVGRTDRTLEKRWSNYENEHDNPRHHGYGRKIHVYMREQGFDNFKMEYLESVPKEYGPQAEGMWYSTFKDLGFDMKNKYTPGNGDNVRGTICYENNRASQREKIPCELCGKMICRGDIRKHQRRSNCIPRL